MGDQGSNPPTERLDIYDEDGTYDRSTWYCVLCGRMTEQQGHTCPRTAEQPR